MRHSRIYWILRRIWKEWSNWGVCSCCGKFVFRRIHTMPARSTGECDLCKICHDINEKEWEAAWDEYYSERL